MNEQAYAVAEEVSPGFVCIRVCATEDIVFRPESDREYWRALVPRHKAADVMNTARLIVDTLNGGKSNGGGQL